VSGRVAGKVAFVTGAARGIGRASALRLAQDGAHVALLDIGGPVETVPYAPARLDQLDGTAEGIRALGVRALALEVDVRDGASLAAAAARTVDEFGSLDIMVAAAGIDSWGDAWALTDEQWRAMIDVNLTGVWQTAKAVAPHMMRQGSGSMVFIGSVLSHRANRQFAHYTAAKHGVLGIMRAFGLELAPFGIRANSVDPTAVYTDMITSQAYMDRLVGHANATLGEVKAHYLSLNTMPVPWIEPIDVANAVLFLSSDEARYITGVALPVDLGALLK
jgi:SDR family mycofactocin-dependent oxidoreductase